MLLQVVPPDAAGEEPGLKKIHNAGRVAGLAPRPHPVEGDFPLRPLPGEAELASGRDGAFAGENRAQMRQGNSRQRVFLVHENHDGMGAALRGAAAGGDRDDAGRAAGQYGEPGLFRRK